MARTQKASTPVNVPMNVYLQICRADTLVFPLGKTSFPVVEFPVVVAPNL